MSFLTCLLSLSRTPKTSRSFRTGTRTQQRLDSETSSSSASIYSSFQNVVTASPSPAVSDGSCFWTGTDSSCPDFHIFAAPFASLSHSRIPLCDVQVPPEESHSMYVIDECAETVFGLLFILFMCWQGFVLDAIERKARCFTRYCSLSPTSSTFLPLLPAPLTPLSLLLQPDNSITYSTPCQPSNRIIAHFKASRRSTRTRCHVHAQRPPRDAEGH